MVKIGQAVSEKKTLKDYEILNMYKAQGQGQITQEDRILIVYMYIAQGQGQITQEEKILIVI